MRQRSAVLLAILVSMACLWSGCAAEDVLDPAQEMNIDEILEDLSNASTQAEVEIATNYLLDKTAVGAPSKGGTDGLFQCIKDAVDGYIEVKEELTKQYTEGAISIEEYTQEIVNLTAACRERMSNCLVEDELRKGYEDVVFPEIQLGELIPGKVIFGKLDRSGQQHFVDLVNQAAQEEQIPDELEAILEAIEDKLTQEQRNALTDLDLDELQQFIEETGEVPVWLGEIFEIFEEDPILNFLMPKVSLAKVIPSEIIPPKIIWPGGNSRAPSSSPLQLEPAAAPSADYDACVQAAQSTHGSVVIVIENDFDNTVVQINLDYDNLISQINQIHADCTAVANTLYEVQQNIIAAELVICEGLAAVLGASFPPFSIPLGIAAAIVCGVASAADYANAAIVHLEDIQTCNNSRAQNEQLTNNLKAQNMQAANNAKTTLLLDAQAQLAADLATCHDQGAAQ